MKKIIYSLVFCGVSTFATAQQNENNNTFERKKDLILELQTQDKSSNFLLMGDFGRYGQFKVK